MQTHLTMTEIFDYFSTVPDIQQPRLLIQHKGRVLATFNNAQHWQSARTKIREASWATEVHAATTPRSSHVIWEPI